MLLLFYRTVMRYQGMGIDVRDDVAWRWRHKSVSAVVYLLLEVEHSISYHKHPCAGVACE